LFGRAVNVANDGPFGELLKHALKAAADINGLVGVKLNYDWRQPAIKKIGQEGAPISPAMSSAFKVAIRSCQLVSGWSYVTVRPAPSKSG
jgi:hypothetical protein